jgi:DNA-binding CsgD family transcriptional regulator
MRGVIGREPELGAIERFLGLLDDGPAVLFLDGEPGIGKTALVRSAVDAATARGHRVLSCAGTPADARLAFAALGDLLGDVPLEQALSRSSVQLRALDAALLRGDDPVSGEVDLGAVSAATLSVLRWLGSQGPVVVAVDDLPWLDAPSRSVLAFCARRLPSGVGLLASRRTDAAAPPVNRAAGLLDPDRVAAVTVTGLSADELRRLVRAHASTTPERRLLNRIVEVSGGNPLYALELLHGLPGAAGANAELVLPASLVEMVRARVAGLGRRQRSVLLAVAAMAAPTLMVLTEALGPGVVEALSEPERRGILTVDSQRVAFTHPVLAEGIYSRATAAERRDVHRSLSAVSVDVEDRARHLAAAGILPEALVALEDAAAEVRTRGAPDSAAELLELALDLGADRALVVRAAEHRFDAGDTRGAVRMLDEAIASLPAGVPRAEALMLLGEIRYKDDSFPDARVLLDRARQEAGGDERLLLMSELRLAFTLYNLGQMERASELSQAALERADRLGEDGLLAQALAVSVIVDFSLGRNLDEPRLARALELQDSGQRTGAELHPGLIASFVFQWSGRFDRARTQLDEVCAQYLELGEESSLAWASFVRVWVESASGDGPSTMEAAALARDRLLLLDTVAGRALALAAEGEAAAYTGRYDDARRACEESLALFSRSGWTTWSWFPRMTLGSLELARGDSTAAVAALDPIVTVLSEHGDDYDPAPGGILFAGDAAESLVAVGRVSEAEEIVERLEVQGQALGRPWAMAVGARCRALLQAAEGDLVAAEASLVRAMTVHDGLAMPVERARTLLTLGRVHRAQRQRRLAREVLEEARSILETVGSPLWRDRVDEELARLGLRHRTLTGLSASEERVARLAASGLTNRQVAARLSISPKTVEAHLSRAYVKLGVHSRAELGARMAAESSSTLSG